MIKKKFSTELANGSLLLKLLWPTVRKKIVPSDGEKLLKFKAEGWEFANVLSTFRSSVLDYSVTNGTYGICYDIVSMAILCSLFRKPEF